MFTLLLGGVRSGKSALAVDLARAYAAEGGAVTFIATAPRIDGDADLDARIDAHRATRPPWPTVEAPRDLADAVALAAGSFVLLDCITLWVNNLLYRGDTDDEIDGRAVALAAKLAARTTPSVVISNEVGLGVHPETELGRRYRDVLGRTNQTLAARADSTLLLVAGRALRLDDPKDLL